MSDVELIPIAGKGIPGAPIIINFGGFCQDNSTTLFGKRASSYCYKEGFAYLSYITPALNGSGENRFVKDLTFQKLVSEVKEVILHVPHGEKALVIAYSFWVWVFIVALKKHPELREKSGSCIFLGPAYNCLDQPFKNFYKHLNSTDTDQAKLDLAALDTDNLVRDSNNVPYKMSFWKSSWLEELEGTLPFLDMPITVIQGSRDPTVPVESTKKLFAMIPESQDKKIIITGDLTHNFESLAAWEIVRGEIEKLVTKHFLTNKAGVGDYSSFSPTSWFIYNIDQYGKVKYIHRLTKRTFDNKEQAKEFQKTLRSKDGMKRPLDGDI